MPLAFKIRNIRTLNSRLGIGHSLNLWLHLCAWNPLCRFYCSRPQCCSSGCHRTDSPQWNHELKSKFPNWLLAVPFAPNAYCTASPTNSHFLDYSNYILRRIQVMKLFLLHFFSLLLLYPEIRDKLSERNMAADCLYFSSYFPQFFITKSEIGEEKREFYFHQLRHEGNMQIYNFQISARINSRLHARESYLLSRKDAWKETKSRYTKHNIFAKL
jgi:hypothetical protein